MRPRTVWLTLINRRRRVQLKSNQSDYSSTRRRGVRSNWIRRKNLFRINLISLNRRHELTSSSIPGDQLSSTQSSLHRTKSLIVLNRIPIAIFVSFHSNYSLHHSFFSSPCHLCTRSVAKSRIVSSAHQSLLHLTSKSELKSDDVVKAKTHRSLDKSQHQTVWRKLQAMTHLNLHRFSFHFLMSLPIRWWVHMRAMRIGGFELAAQGKSWRDLWMGLQLVYYAIYTEWNMSWVIARKCRDKSMSNYSKLNCRCNPSVSYEVIQRRA